MTLLATTCIAFAIIRSLEEGIRFILSFFFSRSKENKFAKTFNPDYKRLTVNITPELHELIKAHCIKTGVTITQYTFRAVVNQLKEDKIIKQRDLLGK